jgi:hypothetical protein
MTLSMTEILILSPVLMGPTKALLVYAGLSEKMDVANMPESDKEVVAAILDNVTVTYESGGGQ